MFQKFRPVAMAWPILCAVLIGPQARAQLRSDLIDSARIEKEGNLTPETAPRAEQKVVWVPVPRGGFGLRVVIENKFVPHDLDPRIGDPRTLGAQVDYKFFTQRPR